MDTYIEITTNDNIIFNINTKILKISQFLNSLENNEEIILPNVNNICFLKIIEFLEEHSIINEQNDSYLKNLDDDFIFELLNASNYLLIDTLINLLQTEIYNRILQKINEEKLFSYILTDENI